MTLNLTPDLLTVPLSYPIVTVGGSFMDKIPEMINISQLNRGYAGKILEDVKKNDSVKVIVKNNEPEAVLISVKLYNEMAANSFRQKVMRAGKEHKAFGSLHQYAKNADREAERKAYQEMLNKKYGK